MGLHDNRRWAPEGGSSSAAYCFLLAAYYFARARTYWRPLTALTHATTSTYSKTHPDGKSQKVAKSRWKSTKVEGSRTKSTQPHPKSHQVGGTGGTCINRRLWIAPCALQGSGAQKRARSHTTSCKSTTYTRPTRRRKPKTLKNSQKLSKTLKNSQKLPCLSPKLSKTLDFAPTARKPRIGNASSPGPPPLPSLATWRSREWPRPRS